MKRLFLTIVLVVTTSTIYSQSLKIVELSNEEIQYLSKNQKSMLGGVDVKQIANSVEFNKTLFFFEILNDGKVLYKEAIKRSSPVGYSMELDRLNVSLCLRYKDISPELALNLLEDSKWKLLKFENERFISNSNFKVVIQKVGNKITYHPNNEIDGLEVKLYKLIEE